MPFGIFASRALRRANIGAVTLFGSYISFQFLVTQYLQTLAGWSAIDTALAFLPAGVMVVLLSTRMGPLLGRFGPGPLTALAFAELCQEARLPSGVVNIVTGDGSTGEAVW